VWGKRWTQLPGEPPKPPGNKYKNQPVVDNAGVRHASLLETKVNTTLNLMLRNREILAVGRQVRLQLMHDCFMKVDFVVHRFDFSCVWLDAKGYATPDWRTKQKMAFNLHGITVHTLTSDWLKNPIIPED